MKLRTVLAMVLAYLIGAVPTGYIITRILTGRDIRELGDRYSGAKNVLREVGPAAGVATAAGDLGKGVLAVVQARALGAPEGAMVAVALAAVAGHIWPVFLQFRGGAGLATSVGAVLAALPREALLLFVPYVTLLTTAGRRVGLGLASAPLILPLLLLSRRLKEPTSLAILPLPVGALVAVRVYHKEIRRALAWLSSAGRRG